MERSSSRSRKPRQVLDPSIANEPQEWKKKPRKKANKVKALSKNMLSSACVSCATQGDDKNDILFCDGCDVAHCQNCVGLTTVPSEDWFCASCTEARVASHAKAGFGDPLWSGFVRRVTGLCHKIARHEHFVRTYDVEASKSAFQARNIPKAELHKERRGMYAAKHAVRTLLKDLTQLNSQNKQWAALKSENDKKATADDGSDIDVEDVGCSICGFLESTEENDILLCDHAGCCRAYHMACLSPAVTRADIIANQIAKKKQLRLASSSGSVSSDGEDEEEDEEDNDVDEDWFCPQCDCLQTCFDTIAETFNDEKPKGSWEEVFPEATNPLSKEADEERGPGERSGVMNGTLGGLDDDDDDEEDSDFDPDAKGSDQEEVGMKDDGNDSDDNSDNDDGGDDNDDNDGSDSSEDSGSDESASDDNSVHGSELDALMEEAGLSDNEVNHTVGDDSKPRLRLRTTTQQIQPTSSSSSVPSAASRKGRPAGRGYVLISESESEEEGDGDGSGTRSRGKRVKQPLVKAQDDGTLDEANIVQGKRRRKFVDYVALNGELFGALDASGVSHPLVDDEEQWKPGMASPESTLSPFTTSNSTEATTSIEHDDDKDDDSDLLEAIRRSKADSAPPSEKEMKGKKVAKNVKKTESKIEKNPTEKETEDNVKTTTQGREKKKASIRTQAVKSSCSSSSSSPSGPPPSMSESKQRFPVGTRFFKEFDGFGVFGGKVVEVYEDEVDTPEVLYRVQYDDGDEEDLNHHELADLIARAPFSK